MICIICQYSDSPKYGASGKTKTEAKTKLRELLRDQDDGVPTPVDGYTVADAVAYWLTYGVAGP